MRIKIYGQISRPRDMLKVTRRFNARVLRHPVILKLVTGQLFRTCPSASAVNVVPEADVIRYAIIFGISIGQNSTDRRRYSGSKRKGACILIVHGVIHFLGRLDVKQVVIGIGLAGPENMIEVSRDGNSSQNANNSNNN